MDFFLVLERCLKMEHYAFFRLSSVPGSLASDLLLHSVIMDRIISATCPELFFPEKSYLVQ